MLYVYRCECGETTGKIRRVAERDNPVVCDCGKTMTRTIPKARFKMTSPREDLNKTTRRLTGTKRGERTHENIYTDEVIQLSGNNDVAKDQIRRSYDSPKVPKKIREAAADNKMEFPNLT